MASSGGQRHRRVVGRLALVATALMALAAMSAAFLPHAKPSAILRTIALGQAATAMAVDTRMGRAFIAVDDANDVGRVATIDLRGGRLIHTTRVGALPGMVAVDDKTQRVFVGNESSASVSMLDARSGRLLRTLFPGCPAIACTSAMGAPPSALVIDTRAGRVFVDGTIAGLSDVSVVDARSGVILRIRGGASSVNIGGGLMAVDERWGRIFALDGGVRETRLSVLDARGGTLLRAIPVGSNARAMAADERTGRLFVISDAAMTIVDARSGKLLGMRAMSSAATDIQTDMQVDEASGRVVVADAMGSGVSAYDGRQGKLLWTKLTGLVVNALAIDQQREHILVATGTSVYVLDARSGATLRAISWHERICGLGIESTLGIDEHTGHAIVVTDTDNTPVVDPWTWLPGPLRRLLPQPRRPSTNTICGSVSMFDTTH